VCDMTIEEVMPIVRNGAGEKKKTSVLLESLFFLAF
jgi:hypothetical protein